MRGLPNRVLPVSVQSAVVSVILVVALLPLGSPLPELAPGTATASGVAAAFLGGSVAVLGGLTLIQRWRRFGSTARVLVASIIGLTSSVTLFGRLSGLVTRPLLLVAAIAMMVVSVLSFIEFARKRGSRGWADQNGRQAE